jgi:predicted RecB family nuclease
MLSREIPDVAIGAHCTDPYECPFLDRCHPELPDDHVSTLYRIHEKTLDKLLGKGVSTLHQMQPGDVRGDTARRQIRSVQQGVPIVEHGLRTALTTLRPPLAYLDFETINPAIPVWPGCTPYGQVPVQLSCHVRGPDGSVVAHSWLADGDEDPRRALAEKLLEVCGGAKTIVAYNASFEKQCIRLLADALPDLATRLQKLESKLVDLLPVVRDHVYHPEFGGSFSLKSVLPALVPDLGYDDLEIQDGETASAALVAILLEPETLDTSERGALRAALLRYCERDTLAMVRLHERLVEMAQAR